MRSDKGIFILDRWRLLYVMLKKGRIWHSQNWGPRGNMSPKESMLSSNLDAVPNLHRALSLLSTDSWGSESPNIIPDHPIQRNFTSMPQFAMLPQGLPLTSSEYWQSEWSTDARRAHSLTTNDSGHFQGIKVFKSSNLLN
ncbi:hypothetical protein CsSME_00036686 [Camellia sinensis var. sinensis]